MDIDLTFKPVAAELIDNVFPTPITYFRETFSNYDPATGDVTPGYDQYNISAGILKRERIEQGGIGESYKLTLWIHHADGGFEFLPTTSDFVQYDSVTWKVIQVDPTYSSDGLVASKLIVSTRFGGPPGDVNPPVISGPSAVTIVNTELFVGTYTADELVTWTLAGPDASLFTIAPVINGTLSFISTPDTRFHYVTVVATDKAGNISTLDVTVEVIPDTVPPSVSGPTDRTINSNETTVATYTANKTSTWSVGGTDAANFSIDANGLLTYVGSIQVGSINSIDIEATDIVGNVGTLPVTVTVVDVVPPVITGPSTVAIDEPIQAVGNYSANEIVTWSLSGVDAGLFSISTLGVLTFADPSVHGVYNVTVVATDEVGLAASRAVVVTVTDVTPPIITGPSTINVVEGDTVLATYTANEAVVWTLTGAESNLFNIDAGGNLTFVDPAVFGTYAVVVVATDIGNNFSTLEVTVVVNDVIPPNITGPNTVGIDEPDQVVASYTADEDVTWTVGGVDAALFTITPTASNAADLTFTNPSVAGSYTPIVTATDQGSNQDLLAVAVTVSDVTPPIITGPSTVAIDEPNQTVASYSANESVTWSVGGVDAGLFTITVNGDLSFTNPSVHGTYAVDVIATDIGSNATTLSVAVTVTDVTPPVITGPGTVQVGEPDQAVATYTANEAVTWSITGPDVALFTITQGGELSFIASSTLGNYSVTVVATDVGSNVTNKGVLVQVVDVTPPVITGPAAPTINEPDQFVAQYFANEAVTWSLSGTDAGLLTIDVSGNLSFSAPSVNGTYDVNVIATDAATNAGTLAVTVTVSDTTPPVITGPSTVTIYFPDPYVATYTADEPVTWSLTGTDAALLDIDTNGVVTVAEDADATTYLDAVEVADGQALEPEVRAAVSNFVSGCKADGIWDAIKACCILAGARTLAGALVPLVGTAPDKFGADSDWNYDRKTGLQGDGSTNYLDSNRADNADLQNSIHVSINKSSISSGPSNYYIGSGLFTHIRTGFHRCRANADYAYTDVIGFCGLSRSASDSYDFRSDSTTSSVSRPSSAGTLQTHHIFKRADSSGQFIDARLSFYSIGAHLDLALLDTRVSTLMTDLAAGNTNASDAIVDGSIYTIRDYSFNVVATDPSTNSSSLAVSANGVWSPGFATTSLWLDAADANTITETGGSVSQWDDKSGNARHATQSTPGQEPTYGAVTQNSLNTVTFDGSNDNLDIASTSIFTSGNADIAIFAAYKPTAAPGSRGAIFGNFSTGNLAVYFGDDAPFVEPWGVYNNADLDLSTDSYVQNGDYIASIVRSDGNFTGWTAGNQNETVANTDSVYAGAGTASTWSIGDTTSGQNASLDLWEFATIDGSISTPERERFEGYLAWKWGLEANLPPTHYWKNEPPNETALTQWSIGINTAGTFTLITNSTCNVDIDWGDGNVDTSVVLIGTTNTEHIYSSAGEYLIKITLNSGDFYPYYSNDPAGDELVTLGDTPAGWSFGTDLSNAFFGSNNLTTVGDIDISSVTNFSNAWRDCKPGLTSFPLLDTSSGTNFSRAWRNCAQLNNITALGEQYSFPQINTSSGTNFTSTWQSCVSLTSFPAKSGSLMDVSSGTLFYYAWFNCSKLTDFPANFFDSWTGTPDNNCFIEAWGLCSSLTATSVENILNSIDTSGQSAPATGPDITIDYDAGTGVPYGGTLDVNGRITPEPASITNLRGRGWTVTLNGNIQDL